MTAQNRIMEFSHFEKINIKAGITLKSSWKNKSDIHDFVKANLSKDFNNYYIPKQIHSPDLLDVNCLKNGEQIVADGLASNNRGNCLTISTADCVPMLFGGKSGWYGAVHIGWRGFVGGIIENFFSLIAENKLDISDIKVVIGPSIGSCCYEIGDEVAILFNSDYLETSEQTVRLNLKKAVVDKLIDLGADEKNMFISNDCTSCDKEKYYSYRRDGFSPIQMISYISRIN